jgi:hypothetical protein
VDIPTCSSHNGRLAKAFHPAGFPFQEKDMTAEPSAQSSSRRTHSWPWSLIIAVWILLFLLVVSLGITALCWRRAGYAQAALNSATADRDNLTQQLSAAQDRLNQASNVQGPLASQLSAADAKLSAANAKLSAANAKLTDATAQLTSKDQTIAQLTSQRDSTAKDLSVAQATILEITRDRDALAARLLAAPKAVADANVAAPQRFVAPAAPPAVPPAPRLPDPVVPIAPGTLAARLDAEFNALLVGDPNALSLREAARLFETSDRSSHWTNYLQALEIIRAHRSKAAIPLLMKFALAQPGFNASSPRQFADALTILTGEEIFLGDARGRDSSLIEPGITKFFEEWYLKNRPTITVDPARMTDEQRRRIVAVLQHAAEDAKRSRHSSNGIAYEANSIIRYGLKDSGRDSKRGEGGALYSAELCPAMVPLLLESAGWSKNPPAAAPQNLTAIPMEIIPMLALLRKDGGAPDLDKIAADPRQANAARLACLLALHTAGESISADALLAIAAQEKALELRVFAISALQYTPAKGVPAKLVEFLTDPNAEIVAAACWSLESNPSADSVAPLKKIIDKGDLKSAMLPAIGALGKIKTIAAADALASFMSDEVKKGSSDRYVYDALYAFYDASGCPRKAGARRQDDVSAALAWWQNYKASLK